MFEAIRSRLEDLANVQDRLLDAAIAVAKELRQKVREGRRTTSRARRDLRRAYRDSGLTASEARRRIGRRRKGSGVSIVARSTGSGVTVTASDQVQHLRRAQGETPDIVDAFRKHMSVAEQLRGRRGL